MPDTAQQRLVNRAVLILVLVVISAGFLHILQPFLQSIFVAALFAALFTPIYRRILDRVGGRQALASMLTLLLVLFFIFVPFVLIFGAVAAQAVEVAESVRPWVQTQLAQPGTLSSVLERIPFWSYIEPYREQALTRFGTFVTGLSGVALDLVQSATLGTLSALVSGLIVLYTMFFFLMDGDRLLYYVLYYLPLDDEDETKLLARFMSVTRATLKGTAVIGILQGGLAGLALYFAGVPSALFWAVVMMFLSVVPGIGTALIWLPAVAWLMFSGEVVAGLVVLVFNAIVVGTIDNLLRPRLVGNDTQLHDLLIFFSTLGGLLVFGFMGFVIGPIIAALFVTVWELYGEEFRNWLPTTAFRPHSGPVELPHQRRSVERAVDGVEEALEGSGDVGFEEGVERVLAGASTAGAAAAAKPKPSTGSPAGTGRGGKRGRGGGKGSGRGDARGRGKGSG